METYSQNTKNILWKDFEKNTKKIKIIGFFVAIFSLLSLFLYAKAQWNTQNYWIYSTIIAFLGTSAFVYYRHQTDKIYDTFMKEVEKRQAETLNLLDYQKKTIKIANNWTYKRFFFFVIGCILLAISTKYISKEIKIRSIAKPHTIKTARKIAQNNTKIFFDKIKLDTTNTKQRLKEIYIKKKVIQKTLTEAQNSFYTQQGNYYQSAGFLQNLYLANNQLQQASTINAKEEVIKQNPLIFAQVTGMKQVQLDILEKETSQAEGYLNNEGEMLKQFNELLAYQQKCQYKAQKCLQNDQKSITTLQQELNYLDRIQSQLENTICEDSWQLSNYHLK